MVYKSVFILNLKDKIPSDSVLAFKESLDKADNETLEKIILLNIKNPLVGLLLSLFLGVFGVDRFYKGDIKLGILKPVVFFTSYILTLVFSAAYLTSTSTFYMLLSFVFGLILIAALIWFIADIFLVYFGIKKDNLAKIYQLLSK